MKQNRKPFDIPDILTSLRMKYQSGSLTLEQVAEELYRANQTFYIDLDFAKNVVSD